MNIINFPFRFFLHTVFQRGFWKEIWNWTSNGRCFPVGWFRRRNFREANASTFTSSKVFHLNWYDNWLEIRLNDVRMNMLVKGYISLYFRLDSYRKMRNIGGGPSSNASRSGSGKNINLNFYDFEIIVIIYKLCLKFIIF